MTTEEAIKIIRRKTSIPENGETFEGIEKAYDMAVEALEKQIPKAPIRGYISAYFCPCCVREFAGTGIADYCYHCGQALKWDDMFRECFGENYIDDEVEK